MAKKVTKSELLRAIDKEKQRELCDFFNINEKSLRKSLMQTADGMTKINLLKMSFDEPASWNKIYNATSDILHNIRKFNSYDECIEFVKSIYCAVVGDTKFKKYKKCIKNDARMSFELHCLMGIINDMNNIDDESQKNFYAQLIYSHCDLLLKDIDMV